MNAKQFFDEVVKLRQLQKDYFRTRTGQALSASKKQEKLIDQEIERVNGLMERNSSLIYIMNKIKNHE